MRSFTKISLGIFLTLSVAIILVGCSEESDNDDDLLENYGTVLFWMDANNCTNVNTVCIEIGDEILCCTPVAQEPTDCIDDEDSGALFLLEVGTYQYYATDGTSVEWDGEVEITGGDCALYELACSRASE
jgi:hypothetical protein